MLSLISNHVILKTYFNYFKYLSSIIFNELNIGYILFAYCDYADLQN